MYFTYNSFLFILVLYGITLSCTNVIPLAAATENNWKLPPSAKDLNPFSFSSLMSKDRIKSKGE